MVVGVCIGCGVSGDIDSFAFVAWRFAAYWRSFRWPLFLYHFVDVTEMGAYEKRRGYPHGRPRLEFLLVN